MTQKDSLHSISTMSCLACGNVLGTAQFFAGIMKGACCKGSVHGVGTMKVLYRWLAWSLNACLINRHPVLDWDLHPWTRLGDEYRASMANQKLNDDDMFYAILGICADLEELCNEFGPAHVNSNSPCFWCPADIELSPWTNFTDAGPSWTQSYGAM